jgi:hypothetical protein
MATFGKLCSWNPAQSIKVRHFLSASWKQYKALLNGSKLVIALRRAIEFFNPSASRPPRLTLTPLQFAHPLIPTVVIYQPFQF